MQKLIEGIHKFHNEVFSSQVELFKKLEKGQKPQVLFITCSDSRINPNLITQTDPGDLFIIRNAGNIIPSYGPYVNGESATIEFAIEGLGIKDIIVCGHSHCGAMQALLKPELVEKMPSMQGWLRNCDSTRRIVQEHYQHLQDEARLMATIQENVLMQIENLETHPAVAARRTKGNLRIHGWVYKFETGMVFKYDRESGQFVPLVQSQEFAKAESNI